MHLNVKAMPTNDTDYNCYIYEHSACLTNQIWVQNHSTLPLVNDSLVGGHTHTDTHIRTHTHTHTYLHTDVSGQK